MLFKNLILSVAIFFTCCTGYSQDNWVLKKEKDGIKIYSENAGQSKFNKIKVEFNLNGNIYQLANILFDVNNYAGWIYNTKLSSLVKKINNQEEIYYSEVSVPWPMSNRDIYSHIKMHVDSVNKVLTVDSKGLPQYAPERSGIVRVQYSKTHWEISTIDPSKIKVQYFLELDPGGSVPAWIVNMFATKGPFESFKKLGEIIQSKAVI